MAVYRITKFSASNMDKAVEISETLRDSLENVGADFIDLVSCGDGTGVVVAKYPDEETMESATETAKQAFGKMIEAGVVDGGSIRPETGKVFNSF